MRKHGLCILMFCFSAVVLSCRLNDEIEKLVEDFDGISESMIETWKRVFNIRCDWNSH